MREIKFRIWDDTNKVLYTPEMETDMWKINIMPNGVLKEKDDVFVMQYTGLKDKSGVEIYEGDIINCTVLGGESGEEESICKVEYDDKLAAFTIIGRTIYLESEILPHLAMSNKNKWWLNLSDCWNVDIIGNIYQNDYLLSSDSEKKEGEENI